MFRPVYSANRWVFYCCQSNEGFFLHPSTSMFQCNNLLVSYIPVISKHFHTIVTIIKHINVIQNIYMLQLFLSTTVVSCFQVSTCT